MEHQMIITTILIVIGAHTFSYMCAYNKGPVGLLSLGLKQIGLRKFLECFFCTGVFGGALLSWVHTMLTQQSGQAVISYILLHAMGGGTVSYILDRILFLIEETADKYRRDRTDNEQKEADSKRQGN